MNPRVLRGPGSELSRARVSGCVFAFLVLLASLSSVHAERPRIYAITGVRIVTAPGQVIEKGTIVLRDGLIEAVGDAVSAPPDAQVIEGKENWTVYPAFIDAAAEVGFKRPEAQAPGAGGIIGLLSQAMRQEKAPGPHHELKAIRPERRMVDELDPSDDRIARQRKLGFGVAQTLPDSGVIRGQSMVFSLQSGEARDLVWKDSWAQVVALESGSFFSAEYPTAKIGAMAAFRQALLDAQRKKVWRQRYEADPRGMSRPDFESSDQPLIDLLEGRVPALFMVQQTLDHGRFGKLAQEFGLKGMVLARGCEEDLIQLTSSGLPVLLPLKFPKKPAVDKEEELDEVAVATLETYLAAPGVPASLAERGTEFALVSQGMDSPGDFHKNLKKAVDAGLSPDRALAAVTTVPARLLGIDSMLGTLEAGKVANLIVVEGDLFAEKPDFRYVFVDGRDEAFEEKEQKGDPNAVVDPRGTWEVTTEVMGRSNPSVWTIDGSPGSYKGTTENERQGKRDFESVALEGDALTVRISSPMGSLEVTVVIKGEEFEGETKFDTPQGSIPVKVKGKRTAGPGEGEE